MLDMAESNLDPDVRHRYAEEVQLKEARTAVTFSGL